MNIPKCHAEGCDRDGVVTLEVETWEVLPETKQSYHYCLAHTAEKEAQIDNQKAVARRLEVVPEVGMPCTESVGSDSYPATVVEVNKTRKRVLVRGNRYTAAPGSNYFTDQRYVIDETPTGETHTYSLRNNGRWVLMGGNRRCGQYLALGFRRAHQDPHF